jgi:hypothetical protein
MKREMDEKRVSRPPGSGDFGVAALTAAAFFMSSAFRDWERPLPQVPAASLHRAPAGVFSTSGSSSPDWSIRLKLAAEGDRA